MAATTKPEFVKAGYWWSESSFRPATNINTDLFTHIFCAFADLDPSTKKLTISPIKSPQISTFSATIKQKNPNLKTIISIAGKPETFTLMAAQSCFRKSFINSSIAFARQFSFDGLDLHWLFPSKSFDMPNLSSLLHEWRDAIVEESQRRRLPQLLLIASVFYSPYPNSLLYPIAAMKATLDWINLLAYDFYTPISSPELTGPSSAFFNSKTKTLSGDYGVKEWIRREFPSSRIVLGLPFYGWNWVLLSGENHGPFSAADGPSPDKMIGVSPEGRVDYSDIVKIVNEFAAKTVYDEGSVFSYAYYSTNWIAYDDENSVTAKILEAKNLGLLGYFAWHVGADDEYSTLAATASQQWDA